MHRSGEGGQGWPVYWEKVTGKRELGKKKPADTVAWGGSSSGEEGYFLKLGDAQDNGARKSAATSHGIRRKNLQTVLSSRALGAKSWGPERTI